MLVSIATLVLFSAPITVVDQVKSVTDAVVASRGKIVVLKFWATWCGPCVEEFPDVLAVLVEYSPKDVSVISISADDKDAVVRYVQPFLERVKMPFPTLLVDVDSHALIDAVDKTWNGTLPAVFVYDRQGKLSKRILGPSAKALKKTVDGLLKP